MQRTATLACASIALLVLALRAPDAATPDAPMSSSPSATALPADAPAPRDPTPRNPAPRDSVQAASYRNLVRSVYGPPGDALDREAAADVDKATLWLARCIYSETKQPLEQELVAWVVRNRVETGYRGQTTYRGVVLDPYQFSAFNRGSAMRGFYMSLDARTRLAGWQNALRIAHFVRHADAQLRPFSIRTRHFFSERSMPDERHPNWAEPRRVVTLSPEHPVEARRFRFYAEIS